MRKINEAGLAILKRFETLQLEAYDDGVGVWTIGWGHTGPEVVPGLKIDAEEAERLLLKDLLSAEKAVSRLVRVAISDNAFSALVVFVYNVGEGAFEKSTLLKILNSGGYDNVIKAAAQFDRWVYAKGKFLRGLKHRRDAEKQLYLS